MKADKPLMIAAATVAVAWMTNVAWSDQPAQKLTAKEKAVAVTGSTQPAQESQPQKVLTGEKQKVLLTGSRIPTTFKRTGRITDASLNVTVMDREDIQRSGAQTLAGVLARDPAIRISTSRR